MLSHVVLFWLKPDLTAAQRAEFETRLRALGAIPGLAKFHVGTPASTDRSVIDRTYSFGLNLVFPDMAAHDAYQVHPTHQAFVDNCKAFWTKVLIYDFD
jgi:quinol monooxygenase YgiN